jgi:phasin family protein
MFAPIRELNNVAVENIEKIVNIQMKALEETSKAGVESLKGAAAVSDLEGLKTYLTNQAEVSRQLTERALADTKSVMELGNSYNSEVQKVVKDAFKQS